MASPKDITLGVTFNASRLDAAAIMIREIDRSMRAKGGEVLIKEYAQGFVATFYSRFHQAALGPRKTKLWHMYEENRIGVHDSKLFKFNIKPQTRDNGAKIVETTVDFLPNRRPIRAQATGNLGPYFRDGEPHLSGNKRLGVNTRLAFKDRSKNRQKRYKDRRTARPHTWLSQATDVEFGAVIDVLAKNSPKKFLAVATSNGILFTRRRRIDYKRWKNYGEFSKIHRELSAFYEDTATAEVQKNLERRATEVIAKIRTINAAVANKANKPNTKSFYGVQVIRASKPDAVSLKRKTELVWSREGWVTKARNRELNDGSI